MKLFFTILFTSILSLGVFAQDTELATTNIIGSATLTAGAGVKLFQVPTGVVVYKRMLHNVNGAGFLLSPLPGSATTNGILCGSNSDKWITDEQLPLIAGDDLYACSSGGTAQVQWWVKGAVGIGMHNSSVKTLTFSPTNTLLTGGLSAIYTQAITVTGGTSPYYFQSISGAFSNGISMSTTGVLIGTPSVSPLSCGTVAVQATDAAGNAGSFTYTLNTPGLTVNPGSFTSANSGSTGTVIVLTSPGTLVFGTLNTNSWITLLSGTNGTGSNSLVYVTSDNSASGTVTRTGYISLTSDVFSVNQLVTQPGH